MAGSRTERLLNLLIALRATRRGMRREQIRLAVPQYAASPSEAAFQRMFERDKEDLRAIGVPILTSSDGSPGGAEDVYRVDAGAYALPEVTFSTAEVAVLGLAAQVWQQAALAVPAARALTKVRAVVDDGPPGPGDGDEDLSGLVDPVVRTVEPAFSPLHEALRTHRAVEFGYRRADGVATRREVSPWRLVLRSGTWYLLGHDAGRDAARVFRLSRVEGTVRVLRRPASPAPSETVVQDALTVLRRGRHDDGPATAPSTEQAVLRVRPGRGGRLRAMAVRAGTDPGEGELVRLPLPGGAVEDAALPPDLVQAVAAAGADVEVVAPAALREAVRRRWQDVLRAHERPVVVPEQAREAGSLRVAAVPLPGATERLSRLLAVVPFVLRRDGVRLAELAARFDVSERQVVKDLELLFVCGTPGHLPDDLIEADWEGGVVRIGNADAISRPLRLTVEEAVVLQLGLRVLGEVPGPHDRAAMTSAAATLEALTLGQPADLALVPDPAGPPETVVTVTEALLRGRRLRLRYLSAGRDELGERDVDPHRVVHDGGRAYLQGWCHRAGALRLFRLDRVVRAEVLEEAAPRPTGPPRRGHRVAAETSGDGTVLLRLHPGAFWVVEHHGVRVVQARPAAGSQAPDSLLVSLPRTRSERVLRLVLGLGGRAEVLDPAPLRREVVAAATAALHRTAPNG